MRTAWVSRETVCIVIDEHEGSGGTPRRVSCFGQDFHTLASDILGRVDVGFAFMLGWYSLNVGSCEITY